MVGHMEDGDSTFHYVHAPTQKELTAKLSQSINTYKGVRSGLAPATVRGIHTVLHHALKTAMEERLLPANPADKAAPPKIPSKPKGILNDEQTVQQNLGHHTASFTLYIYGHVTEQMKQNSASRMEQFIQSVS